MYCSCGRYHTGPELLLYYVGRVGNSRLQGKACLYILERLIDYRASGYIVGRLLLLFIRTPYMIYCLKLLRIHQRKRN